MPTVSFRNEDKQSVPIAERVNTDKVKEWWVQQYVAAHSARLGFEEVKGPFDSGPDFRVLHKGKWVNAEVEVTCENYLAHKHHENPKWRSCAVLIVLSEKKPAKETKKYLPKTILYLDKAHFEEWYRTAAREFALIREKEKAEGKVFGVSYSGDDCSLEGQSIPAVCPDCYQESPLVPVQAEIEEMTEGQMAEYMAGNWGCAFCPLCQNVVYWNL